MEQVNICINGIREALLTQENITDKVVKEIAEYGTISNKTAIALERSRQALRDSKLLLLQIEDIANKN